MYPNKNTMAKPPNARMKLNTRKTHYPFCRSFFVKSNDVHFREDKKISKAKQKEKNVATI